MTPERRWVIIRAIVWIGIMVYAVNIMRDKSGTDAVGSAIVEAAGLGVRKVVWTELVRPANISAVTSGKGEVAEAVSVFAQLFDATCEAKGRAFRLSLGPTGLTGAQADGPVRPCAAGRIWSAPWPAVESPVELELGG